MIISLSLSYPHSQISCWRFHFIIIAFISVARIASLSFRGGIGHRSTRVRHLMPTLSAPDAQTISVYDAKHQEYLAMVSKKTDERNDVALAKESARETFMNMLPTDNASILDYGCGPGKYVPMSI